LRSEAGPAEEIVEGKADCSELIADCGVEFGVLLFCDAGDDKQDSATDPGTGGVAGDGEGCGEEFGGG
jgi:hypothetical protein